MGYERRGSVREVNKNGGKFWRVRTDHAFITFFTLL
jgi:hypothetical protein